MFSSNPNYTKLKTHLRLAINRLKLLEKKKTELTQKARKEIAEYIAAGKSERAKIRVEHIIREDYMVEAMEIVEMYCDLILARFGLVTQMKELDEGLAEAISCLLWVAPRMHTDIQELKVISDLLTAKYGKIYAEMCRNESVNTVSEKLRHKMSVQSPPKILVERYLIEIAKNYNVNYTPDENVMREEEARDALLIDIGGPPAPPGFIGYGPQMPNLPPPNVTPFNYPTSPSGGKAGGFIANPNYGGTPENYGGTPPGNYGGTPPGNYGGGTPQGNYGGGTPQGNYGGGTPQGNYGAPIHPGSYGSQSYGGPSQGGYNLPPGVDSKTLSNSFLQDEMSNLPPAYDSIHHDMPNLPAAPSGPTYESNPQGPNSYGSTSHGPTPQPRSRPAPAGHFPELPELPSVPSDLILPSVPNSNTSVVHGNTGNNAGTPGSMSASDEIDFEDLNRRFEELKKKK